MSDNQINLDVSEGILILQILSAIQSAKKRHPEFVKTPEQAVSVMGEEFGEFAQAINDKKFEKASQEALDVIAVCCRFIQKNWEKKNYSYEDTVAVMDKITKKLNRR